MNFTVRHLDGLILRYDAAGRLLGAPSQSEPADITIAPETPAGVRDVAANEAWRKVQRDRVTP